MTRLWISIGLAFLGCAALPVSARAQYYPLNPYNPYGPRYSANPGPGYNAGAFLQGEADQTRAYGEVLNATEQARITREKANQAKLDTRKQAFDQMLYEKANTPTYTEALTKDKANILTRLMNFPVRSEITDGKTLNAMLPLLQALSNQGTMGQPVPLSQSLINELNISGSGTGSVGMLRGGGQVDWPIGLQGKNQQALDKLLPDAYNAAATGKLTPKLMKQVRTEMATMRQTLRDQCQKEEIDTSTYLQAIEFYNSLESSINALERPDARKQLSGAYSPRARNVQELVDFMTDNGLKFAPSAPGNENAYQATHDAFVRYARAVQGSAGLQPTNAPVRRQ
jgi:hypothetical protein